VSRFGQNFENCAGREHCTKTFGCKLPVLFVIEAVQLKLLQQVFSYIFKASKPLA